MNRARFARGEGMDLLLLLGDSDMLQGRSAKQAAVRVTVTRMLPSESR